MMIAKALFLFLGDAEPVNIRPSAVIGRDGRTCAECTYLYANPFALFGLEGFAKRLILLSVEAVTEIAHYQ